jgi:DNA-binding PadR family transcriptional regulator
MQSQVNWALLGLVIERPSYAYELAQRFERTYEGVLTLSSVSHAYTALAALRDRGLIEELPGTRIGRQPKPHYQATQKGLEDYEQWLVGQLGEDRRRQRLLVLTLSALTRKPDAALEIIGRYENACLAEARTNQIHGRGETSAGDVPELVARLTGEESRLALGAKLAWVEYARRQFSLLGAARGSAG